MLDLLCLSYLFCPFSLKNSFTFSNSFHRSVSLLRPRPSSNASPSPRPCSGWVWWRRPPGAARLWPTWKDPQRWLRAFAEQKLVNNECLCWDTFLGDPAKVSGSLSTVPPQFSSQLHMFSSEGLRVLALAYKPLDRSVNLKTIERWETLH